MTQVLGKMTAEIREGIQSGVMDLEDLTEDFGWTGIECEVKQCEERATETHEVDNDEVRNVCTLHYRFIDGWMRGLRRVRMRICWDDETRTEFRVGDTFTGRR